MRIIKRSYNWYAVYTRSRAEKRVHEALKEKNIECFLPLKKELRQWSDRKKWVEEPLISCYIFVRVSEKEYYNVLNTLGSVCYVTFEGKAAPIRENQIEALRVFLDDRNSNVELTRDAMAKGDVVEVLSGPLKGVQGEVIQFRGQHRIMLRFESLGCCVHTNISMGEVKRLSKECEIQCDRIEV